MQMMALTKYERLAANAKARPRLLHGGGKQARRRGILNHRTTSVIFSTALILLPGKRFIVNSN